MPACCAGFTASQKAEHKKTAARQTRGFQLTGIALYSSRTRQTCKKKSASCGCYNLLSLLFKRTDFAHRQLLSQLVFFKLFLYVLRNSGFIFSYGIYPLHQNSRFLYLYFSSPNCSYSIVLLFPLKYPMNLETAYLGGISTNMWI